MENPDTLALVTIMVAMISLVGNILQYVFAPKKAQTDVELEVAQAMRTIAEAYDKLFSNLRLEIVGFEEELRLQTAVIEELRKVKVYLEEKVDLQEKQLKEQSEQIDVLRKSLEELQHSSAMQSKRRVRKGE